MVSDPQRSMHRSGHDIANQRTWHDKAGRGRHMTLSEWLYLFHCTTEHNVHSARDRPLPHYSWHNWRRNRTSSTAK